MDAYLNELSLCTYPVRESAQEAFRNFGKCMKVLSNLGITSLRVPANLGNHCFLHGIPYYHIIQDSSLIEDEDLRTLMKSALGTLLQEKEIEDVYYIIDMNVNNIPCKGLGIASENVTNSVAVSFTHEQWNLSAYTVSITLLDEEALPESFLSKTRNVCDESQCHLHQDALLRQKLFQIQTGNELWLKRNELFPNLQFCENVKAQMKALKNGTSELRQVIIKLNELQAVASRCTTEKGIQESDFTSKVTYESKSRERTLHDKLTFLCPDGKEHLCSWHARYTPGAGRIHFYPVESNQVFYIAYIGPKIL